MVQGSQSEPGNLPQIHNKAIAGTKEVLGSHNSGQLPLHQKKQAPSFAGADLPMLNLAMIPPCFYKQAIFWIEVSPSVIYFLSDYKWKFVFNGKIYFKRCLSQKSDLRNTRDSKQTLQKGLFVLE